MGPNGAVVRSVGLENAAQMRLAEHDLVIEAFAPDRADEPLDAGSSSLQIFLEWRYRLQNRSGYT
jgi:hypothetical protein